MNRHSQHASIRNVCAAGVALQQIWAEGERARTEAHAKRMDIAPKGPRTEAPSSIAAAVRMSIADGRALLETGGYAFDFEAGHRGAGEGAAIVGAAGAVMAERFDICGNDVCAEHFPRAWERAFGVIEAVRTGAFYGAYVAMYPMMDEEEAMHFSDTLDDALGEALGNPHAKFKTARAYRAFLDHLERVTLPALECVETATRG